MLTKKTTQRILFALFIGAVIVSFYFTYIKYRSLNFHTRDYAFYLQFASKLLDPKIAKSYSLNPEGVNWLYFYGTEGTNGFNQAIHFEPIKYIYALLYHFSNTPLSLFLLTSTIMFLPLIYAAYAIPMDTKNQMVAVLSVAMLYVFYPSSLMMPSYDLRPYIFLAPFFLLSIMSISFSRPLWEILIWFNAMFLAREEALIFGAVLICYAFTKIKEPDSRRRTILFLCLSLLIWGVAIFSFLIWSGYPTTIYGLPAKILLRLSELFFQKPVLFWIASLCSVAVLVGMLFSWRQLRKKTYFPRLLEILSFGILFLPLIYEFYRNETSSILSPSLGWLIQLPLDPLEYLNFIAILGLAIIVLFPFNGKISRPGASLVVIWSLVILFLSINIFNSQGLFRLSGIYQNQMRSASDIWAVRKLSDKYESWVLVDYSTHQAFYDYQHVYAYNRLPWETAQGDMRYYPANSQIVQEILNDHIEYIVVSQDSMGVINDFLTKSGLVPHKLFENNMFVALQIAGR